MLPHPDFIFTIPSIHDDANLECHIYHPRANCSRPQESIQKRGAVFAHPYAPLGGCFDDPVVASVGSELLKAGFVLGTFNFRGAGASQGSTSWTARAELSDYISFAGFFTIYVQYLSIDALTSCEEELPTGDPVASIPSTQMLGTNVPDLPITSTETIMVFGGYSYGSMICLNLPSTSDMISHFLTPSPGSSQAEVRLRALHLSEQRNHDLYTVQKRHKGASKESLAEPFHSVKFGGEESEPDARHPNKCSQHSFDAIKRNFDIPRKKHGSKHHNIEISPALTASSKVRAEIEPPILQNLRCNYLLVSPLLPPISTFATMFTKLRAPQATGGLMEPHRPAIGISAAPVSTKLTENPTLALYGDQDFFASHKKLRRWAESLKHVNDTCFDFHEIAGAGHFWHEDGVELQMRTLIRAWLESICRSQIKLEHHASHNQLSSS